MLFGQVDFDQKARHQLEGGVGQKTFNVYLHFLDTVSEKSEITSLKVRLRVRQDSPIFQATAILFLILAGNLQWLVL